MENKNSIIASKPSAKSNMLPEFRKHINKCCAIAARQAAKGDMLKNLNKHTKIQKYERSPSLNAGGSTRSFNGSLHDHSNKVITVQRQPGGSVEEFFLPE